MSKTHGPADTLRDGSLKATIWRNHGEDGDFYSTTLAKTYEDRDGKLQDTHSFTGTELLRVAELARAAYGRTNELRREQTQEREAAPEQGQDERRTGRDDGYNDRQADDRGSRRDAYRSRRATEGSTQSQSRPGPQR